jgi:hypothetical protein
MPLRLRPLSPLGRSGRGPRLLVPGLPASGGKRHGQHHGPDRRPRHRRPDQRIHQHRRQRQHHAAPVLPDLRLVAVRQLVRTPAIHRRARGRAGRSLVRQADDEYLDQQRADVGLSRSDAGAGGAATRAAADCQPELTGRATGQQFYAAQSVVESHLKEIQDAWHHHFGG